LADVQLATGRTADADQRIVQSEARFKTGRELLAAGQHAKARVEFDASISFLIGGSQNTADRSRLELKYRELTEAIYRLELEKAVTASPNAEPVFESNPVEEIVEMTFPVEPGLVGQVKAQVMATVSQLPLEAADPVVGFINYFSSTRGRRVLTYGLTRAGRYAPMIRRILDEEGVPQELIYLAQAESGFVPRAVSRMKAAGMWQFIQSRGREYGLVQVGGTDDRLDPEKATRAAARHLRDLYTQFGDWYLAIAAYNCGPGNVEKAVLRSGYADFWELYKRNLLPRETANYLPIILAMTIMSKNARDYGLESVTPDAALDYDTFTVPSATHLSLLADGAGRPISEIRDLNPAILKLTAPANYEVHVPKGTASYVLAALESVPVDKRTSWRFHKVGAAETMPVIARQYRTTEKSIASANRVEEIAPEEGDLLVVPVSYPDAKPAPTKTVNTKKPAAKAKTTAKTTAKPSAPAPAKKTPTRTLTAKAPAPKPASKPKTMTAATLIRGTARTQSR
jgi:membrane-bound lytic murein transglycosylase D